MSVVYSLLGAFHSVLDTVSEWGVMAPKKNCVTLLPRTNLPIAGRDQYISGSGIGSPWELGGPLCPFGISPRCTLSRCESSNWTTNDSFDQLFDLRIRFDLVWDEGDNIILSVGDPVGLFPQIRLVQFLWYMGLLVIAGHHFDAIVRSSFCASISEYFGAESEVSAVTHGDNGGITITTSARLCGGESESSV